MPPQRVLDIGFARLGIEHEVEVAIGLAIVDFALDGNNEARVAAQGVKVALRLLGDDRGRGIRLGFGQHGLPLQGTGKAHVVGPIAAQARGLEVPIRVDAVIDGGDALGTMDGLAVDRVSHLGSALVDDEVYVGVARLIIGDHSRSPCQQDVGLVEVAEIERLPHGDDDFGPVVVELALYPIAAPCRTSVVQDVLEIHLAALGKHDVNAVGQLLAVVDVVACGIEALARAHVAVELAFGPLGDDAAGLVLQHLGRRCHLFCLHDSTALHVV